MLSPESLTAITIFFYLLATLTGLGGFLWHKAPMRSAGCWLAVSAFLCQTLTLIFGFHRLMPDGLSLGAYLQLLAWFLLLFGIGAWLRLKQDSILLFVAPLGLILFLLSTPWLKAAIRLPPSLSTPFYALHIGSLLLSLGLLALAFIAALVFLFLERRLKTRKKISGVWHDLPALALLDKINAVCSLSAFPLYTIGLLAGLFWSGRIHGSALSGDAKEVTSVLIWLLLGALFYNRLFRGWHGRKPALLACVIFLLSFFSIVFVNAFISAHHGIVRG